MEGEHKENLGLWCYNTTKTINTKNYSVSDSQRKQELGDVCIQCLRVSKGSVIFFLQIWKIQWGFFFFFLTQEILIPSATLLFVIYPYLEHTTMADIHLGGGKNDRCEYVLTKNDFVLLFGE